MLGQTEKIVDTANDIATNHGFNAFLLVLILVAIGLFVWRVWVFFSPLMKEYIEVNINTTKRNADSLEVIGGAAIAQEKNSELMLKKMSSIQLDVATVQEDVSEVKERIETLEAKLEV